MWDPGGIQAIHVFLLLLLFFAPFFFPANPSAKREARHMRCELPIMCANGLRPKFDTGQCSEMFYPFVRNMGNFMSIQTPVCARWRSNNLSAEFPVRHVHVHQVVFIQSQMSSNKTCHGSHHVVEVFQRCRNRYLVVLQDLTVSEKCPGRLPHMMQFGALRRQYTT